MSEIQRTHETMSKKVVLSFNNEKRIGTELLKKQSLALQVENDSTFAYLQSENHCLCFTISTKISILKSFYIYNLQKIFCFIL